MKGPGPVVKRCRGRLGYEMRRSSAAGIDAQAMGKSTRKLSFEEAMQRLDAIVEAMESGTIGIEESIARYEEAMGLAAQCRQILDQAEQRVRKVQLDAANQLQVTPFETPPAGDADDEPDTTAGDPGSAG